MNKEKELMREKIISAAMKVFSKYGFFKAPVHLIAEEAGVSKGLIFWYFRNKQNLIIEVAKRCLPLEIIDSCLERGLRGKNMLECIGRSYINKYSDPIQRSLFLHTMTLEMLSQEIAMDIRRICEERINIIAKKVFGEASTRAKVAIRAFLGGLMCYVIRPPKDIDEQTFLENLIDIILTGYSIEK